MYVVVNIFSRKIIGWLLERREEEVNYYLECLAGGRLGVADLRG